MNQQASSETRRKAQNMRNIDDSYIKRGIDRRSFLGITGAAAVAMVAEGLSTPAIAEPSVQAHVNGRRKLGSLEV